MHSAERHAEDLHYWIEARANYYLRSRVYANRHSQAANVWLAPRILNHVLEEKRWQWSIRITKERRYHTKRTRRVEELTKDGVLQQDFQVSKPRTASDRARALGMSGKNHYLWREIQPILVSEHHCFGFGVCRDGANVECARKVATDPSCLRILEKAGTLWPTRPPTLHFGVR